MSDKKRVLRIRVSKEGKGDTVNVTLPFGVAKLIRFGPIAHQLKKQDIDIDDLLEDLDDLDDGKVIDVTDDKSGDHVEIYVETRREAKTPEEMTVG
jgi:hypothetical protein